jgi:3-hydroxy-3-methylglutaryl CoA synthase
MTKPIGILGHGGHVPRLRLARAAAVEANGWFNPALRALGKGERAMCNWDEDSVTMAVDAARDCLNGARPADLAALHFASTTFPFADRQNAGIVAAALNLPSALQTMDVAGSQRAGTTALVNALNVAASGAAASGAKTLLVAADHRRARGASAQELQYGDGAAALLVGAGDVIAEFLGSHQVAADFLDHFRGQAAAFDYAWEERWIRDEGYFKIAPPAIAALLDKTGVAAAAVDHFILPAAIGAVPAKIAGMAGIREAAVADTLMARMGESGAAHPLVLLAHVLERARPGETILVAGWGQGCDALLFRATEALTRFRPRRGVARALAEGRTVANYNRFLAFGGTVERERGIRAEFQIKTAPSSLHRNADMVIGFVGGRCRACGTVQYPRANYCVNPNCGALRSQDPYPMAEMPAKVQSWTADKLTYSPDPPTHFGMIVFHEGGRLMADMTDVDAGDVAVGMPVRMVFRIKTYDAERGFTAYFWKAAPDRAAPDHTAAPAAE